MSPAAEVQEALAAAHKALSIASRILSEEHKVWLSGRRWGGEAIDKVEAAMQIMQKVKVR